MPIYESNGTKIIVTRSYDSSGTDITSLLFNYLLENIKGTLDNKNLLQEEKKDEQ